MARQDYNSSLVDGYGTREISLAFDHAKVFYVNRSRFEFRARRCPDTGQPVVIAQLTYPDGSTWRAKSLVLLIQGLSPCKDTPFDSRGWLSRHVPHFRLTTKLAKRDYSKRRIKYNQEQRRIQEANEEISRITRGGTTIIPGGNYYE